MEIASRHAAVEAQLMYYATVHVHGLTVTFLVLVCIVCKTRIFARDQIDWLNT